MTYTVNIEECRTGRIAVEADSHDQASELVQAMITDGELEEDRVVWDDGPFEIQVLGSVEI